MTQKTNQERKEPKLSVLLYVKLRPEHALRCEPFRKWAVRYKFPPQTTAEWDQKWADFESLG